MASRKKRNLFGELVEGVAAMRAHREGNHSGRSMTTWNDFMEELRAEAKREGKLAEFARLEERYRIARQLMQRRLELGLSQKELAARTGIDQSEISRLEGGGGNPTLRTLSAVAGALHGSVRVVFPKAARGP